MQAIWRTNNAWLPGLVESVQLADTDTHIQPNIVLVSQVWSLTCKTQVERVGAVVFHTHGHSDLTRGEVPVDHLLGDLGPRLIEGADVTLG